MTLRLRSKLALGFALVAAVPLVVMQVVASERIRAEFVASTEAQLEASRSLLERRFAREGERVTAQVTRIEADYRLREALLAHRGGQERDAHYKLIRVIEELAREVGLALLTVHDASGTLLASAQEPARFGMVEDGVAEVAASRAGRPSLDLVNGLEVRGLALQVVLPLDPNISEGFLSGGVLVDQALLEELPVVESLALLVVSKDGVVVSPTHAGAEARALLGTVGVADEVQARLGRGGWEVRSVSLGGMVAHAPVSFLLVSSRASLEAILSGVNTLFATLLVLGLGLAWALAWILSRHWTDPIGQLVDGLERVARGDLEARVAITRRDELGRLGSAFDVMAQELADSRERLLQAERIAAWRDIARRLAHEIKNPLSPIALSMDTLRRAYAGARADFPKLLAECTETVLEEVERLRRIVQEFSDFARLPKPRQVEDDFHEIVRGVVSLHTGLGDRYRFVLTLDPSSGVFHFDPDQMNRLLVNLVQNAMQAMPDGGVVRIETHRETNPERFVCAVRDDGPGVPREIARDLFRPYLTTKAGGTGLGLAIAHRIASEHGGSLRLVNPGEPNACFEFTLPLDGRGSDGDAVDA